MTREIYEVEYILAFSDKTWETVWRTVQISTDRAEEMEEPELVSSLLNRHSEDLYKCGACYVGLYYWEWAKTVDV